MKINENMDLKPNLHDIDVIDEKDKKKKNIIVRLKRIEGQVKGIEKMIDAQCGCREILVQISAMKAAINKVGTLVFESYAKNCARDIIKGKDLDELFNILMVFSKETNGDEDNTMGIKDLVQELIKEIQEVKSLVDRTIECKQVIDKVTSIKSSVNRLSSLVFENYAKSCAEKGIEEKEVEELIATLLMFTK